MGCSQLPVWTTESLVDHNKMGTAQFSDMCVREPFHRVTLDRYFHSSQYKSGPTIPLHPQIFKVICREQLPAARTKPAWAAQPFRHPGHPVDQPPHIHAGSGQPTPSRGAAWDACEHTASHASWHQQAESGQKCPLPILGCPFPKGLAALPSPAQKHVRYINKMQLFPPTKNGIPIMLVKKQVLQPPCWSLCSPSQPKHSSSQVCRNPTGLHSMAWD